MSDKIHAITTLGLSLNDFLELTPSEFAKCVDIFRERRTTELNDLHVAIYSAVVQTNSKKPFKPLIKAKETRRTTIEERKATFAFFNLNGGVTDNGK